MIPITVLNILSGDLERFAKQLARKVRQAPGLFQGMPVVLDMQSVSAPEHEIDIPRLALLLGDQGLVPIGVRHGNRAQRQMAQDFGLAVLPDSDGGREARSAQPSSEAAPASTPAKRAAAKLILQPVRSGQQIYAEGGDLIVLASVSPGAEILADGHIHVYGSLHGRALAGVQGDESARIFCRKLYAELVSVAGIYRVYEDVDADLRGTAAQVFLREQQLITESL